MNSGNPKRFWFGVRPFFGVAELRTILPLTWEGWFALSLETGAALMLWFYPTQTIWTAWIGPAIVFVTFSALLFWKGEPGWMKAMRSGRPPLGQRVQLPPEERKRYWFRRTTFGIWPSSMQGFFIVAAFFMSTYFIEQLPQWLFFGIGAIEGVLFLGVVTAKAEPRWEPPAAAPLASSETLPESSSPGLPPSAL